MRLLNELFENNERWATETLARDPEFFVRLAKEQRPDLLWIGCSDSRVHAAQVIGVPPGRVFVHRNVANVVPHTDLNVLSVIQYAVEVLEVDHIVVCGHYGCGGVKAALENRQHGLIDNWLRHIKDVYLAHRSAIDGIADERARVDRLTELNVAAQVANVAYTTIVQNAWRRGKTLGVHGWIYRVEDGRLEDLGLCVTDPDQVAAVFRMD